MFVGDSKYIVVGMVLATAIYIGYREVGRLCFEFWLNRPGRSLRTVRFERADVSRREAIRFAGVPLLLRPFALRDLNKRQPRTKVWTHGRREWSKDYVLTIPVHKSKASFTRSIKLI